MIAYFASSVRAMAPEATGVAALVPPKSFTQLSCTAVVSYTVRKCSQHQCFLIDIHTKCVTLIHTCIGLPQVPTFTTNEGLRTRVG